jgi:hypothetical protein
MPGASPEPWLSSQRLYPEYVWADVFQRNAPVEIDLGAGDGNYAEARAKHIDFTSHLPKVLKNSKSCLSFINDNSDKIYSDDFLNIFLYIKWINALMQYWGLVH